MSGPTDRTFYDRIGRRHVDLARKLDQISSEHGMTISREDDKKYKVVFCGKNNGIRLTVYGMAFCDCIERAYNFLYATPCDGVVLHCD